MNKIELANGIIGITLNKITSSEMKLDISSVIVVTAVGSFVNCVLDSMGGATVEIVRKTNMPAIIVASICTISLSSRTIQACCLINIIY
jgi:methyl coenzyme M reductase subunit C-like uncharacterized protein (methanogenesis marker protein 7)